jgi:hypothetical protein
MKSLFLGNLILGLLMFLFNMYKIIIEHKAPNYTSLLIAIFAMLMGIYGILREKNKSN